MSNKKWFVHMGGETLGPSSTAAVIKMIEQFRLHFADYIWTEGFTKWMRVSEVDEFIGHMPPYPKVAIPSGQGGRAQEAMEEPEEVEAPPPPKKKPAKASSPPPRPAKVEAPPPEPVKVETPPEKPKKQWPKSRRFVRVELKGGVNTPQGKFIAIDISEGGVFVKSDKPLVIGTELKFTLQTEAFEEILEMTGVVIRQGESLGHKGFAIEFTRLNPSYKRLISEYVHSNDEEDDEE